MIDLLKAGYGAQANLADLARDMAGALAQRMSCSELRIRVQGFGELLLERRNSEARTVWTDEKPSSSSTDGAREACAARPAGRGVAGGRRVGDAAQTAVSGDAAVVSFPIEYAGITIGRVDATVPARPESGSQEDLLVRAFARRCAHLFMRYRVRRWIEGRVGSPLLLVGISAPLFELELFVEQACRSMLPVLLTGEFGTEKALLAASIHSCGPRAAGPFVEVAVSSPELPPTQWFERARGGTLFLNGVDELTFEMQSRLSQCLPSRLGQWLTGSGAQEVRLIASTSQDLRKLVAEGKFSRALLAELDFLSATVPPLRERREDIPYYLLSLLGRSGWSISAECQEMLLDVCCRHTWPENVLEVERLVVRLAAMTNGRGIDEHDLRRYAPSLPPSRSSVGRAAEAASDSEILTNDVSVQVEYWVGCALSGNGDALSRLHCGLREALLYLGEHYADPISLPELSHRARLSPSHLSFLFRTVLGAPFKAVLSAIRLERAKQNLKTDPQARITEVAHSVGYGDLSHFERSFRRLVGKSPREYRQSVLPRGAFDPLEATSAGRGVVVVPA